MVAQHRVLVVDDNLELNEAMCEFLRDEGFDARPAIDGHQAIDRATNETPDVIVLDVKLPDIDGVDVLDELQHQGVGSAVILESCMPVPLHHTADAFLAKPFDLDRLLALVQRFVDAPHAPSAAVGWAGD